MMEKQPIVVEFAYAVIVVVVENVIDKADGGARGL